MKLLTFLFLSIHFSVSAQVKLVPMPAEMKIGRGAFIFSGATKIICNKAAKNHAVYLQKALRRDFGIALHTELYNDQQPKQLHNSIQIFLRSDTVNSNAYALNVSKTSVYLDSHNDTLLFNGVQTILQLLSRNTIAKQKNYRVSIIKLSINELSIPQLSIKDFPRFSYRGMHLDVSRHFFPVAEVKKYIDYLAFYKFNTFHWHLTDDQGWRIEIKKYPLLTQVGSCRAQTLIGNYGSNTYDGKKYCGFYTQEQIKEVVKYAGERYISIIPEIEMPGHALAALAASPYLGCTKGPYKTLETWGVSEDVFCAGNDSTYDFIENVLSEVTALFPSAYIHIGGDECPKERWKVCPVCQQKMRSENLKNEQELQSYFIKRIEEFLAAKGKNIIGWDEILEGGIAPGATVMSWNGEEGGITAAKLGHDAIMTPQSHCYFDRSQSSSEDSISFGGYTPIEKIYAYEPVPASLSAEQAKHILGAQGNLWTEYIGNMRKLEYMLFPRMAALAEVLWSPATKRNWNDFEKRLPLIFDDLDARHINYSRAFYEPVVKMLPAKNNEGLLLKINSKKKAATFTFTDKATGKMMLYNDSAETTISRSGVYGIGLTKLYPSGTNAAWDSIRIMPFEYLYTKEIIISFNTATGKKISITTLPAAAYAGNGAFTLVDGIQNNKGMAKSAEFLGFSGSDLEATIDLGMEKQINKIILHSFTQKASWIYPPKAVEFWVSSNGIDFTKQAEMQTAAQNEDGSKVWVLETVKKTLTRFIKVIAKNYGIIPSGNTGADNAAWLFVDELETL